MLVAALVVIGIGLYFVFAPRQPPGGDADRSGSSVSDHDTGDLPDGSRPRGAAGHHRAADRRGDRPGPGARGARGPGERRSAGTSTGPIDARRHGRHPHGAATPTRSSCCATPLRTSWPPPCASSFPAPASASVPPSRTASTTTSRWTGRSRRKTSSGSRPKMAEVAARDYPFVREVVDRAEANRRFADDPLKLERISELGDDETITVYTDGPFTDLCRGPHIPRTGRLKHFKLLHGRRRLLAWGRAAGRCSSGSTAPPGSRRRSSMPTFTGSRRRGSATIGGSARELDLFVFHPFCARRAILDRARDHDHTTAAQRLHAASGTARGLSRRSRRRCCTTRGCGRSPATGASTGRTCSSCSTRRRASTTSRSSR